jgi:hypothetical protein
MKTDNALEKYVSTRRDTYALICLGAPLVRRLLCPSVAKDVASELRRSMRVKDVMRHMRALEAFPGIVPSMAIARAARLVG